jgi:hypothetical protein
MDVAKILNGHERWQMYGQNVEYSEKLKIHSKGENISYVLNRYRPTEPDFIKDYRKENVRAATKAYWQKAKRVIGKANRASGIDIRWEANTERTKEWTLRNKIRAKVFGEYLTVILEDPRSIFIVTDNTWFNDFENNGNPQNYEVFIFGSSQLLYVDEQNVIAMVRDGFCVWFDYANGTITTYFKNEVTKQYTEFQNYDGLIGSYFFGGGSENALSFFDAAVDFWSEALVQYSDLQGSIKSHAYPLPVVLNVQNCEDCSGTGKVFDNHRQRNIRCGTCGGSGSVALSPYSTVQVDAKAYEKNPSLPFPPVYYPQKDLKPIELLKSEYEANIMRGLESLNMEFLNNTGANQSGIAKAIDRDELNGTLYNWVDFLFNYLYQNIVKNAGLYIQKTLVQVYVILPDGFDVYGIEKAEEQLKAAREAKVPNNLLRSLEKDYIVKKYDGLPIEQAFNIDLIDFDFTYGLDPEKAEIILLNGGYTRTDYQMSANLYPLLRKAYSTIEDFFTWDFVRKYEWLIAETENKNIPLPNPEI